MKKQKTFKYAGALVLGMHDALVEISGIIAGLTFAIEERQVIILTAAIAAVAASLSMAAANFQAERANENPDALRCAVYTGLMYVGTCAILILPFVIIPNRFSALVVMAIFAILIIFGFNCIIGMCMRRPFFNRFVEMLATCTGVAVASFLIGQLARKFLGVQI